MEIKVNNNFISDIKIKFVVHIINYTVTLRIYYLDFTFFQWINYILNLLREYLAIKLFCAEYLYYTIKIKHARFYRVAIRQYIINNIIATNEITWCGGCRSGSTAQIYLFEHSELYKILIYYSDKWSTYNLCRVNG